jgi:para-aminobenzoate synthetase component 1
MTGRRAVPRPIRWRCCRHSWIAAAYPQAHPDLPFLGGALGLFGYDLGRRFETLPAYAAADIALPDMAVGMYDWALIVDHQRGEVSLLMAIRTSACGGCRRSLPRQQTFALTSAWRSNMPRTVWRKFRQRSGVSAKRRLLSGQPRPALSGEYSGDEWQAFYPLNRAIGAVQRVYSSAGWRRLQPVAGAFYSSRQGEIQTRPIKGTLPRLADPAGRPSRRKSWPPRRKTAEPDDCRSDAQRYWPGGRAGSVRVPELFVVEPFPAVHHLVSTITARLPDICTATCCAPLSGRLHHRRAQSAGDGDYR